MENKDNKKIALTLIVLGIIISFFGGSLAYWNWETSTEQRTLVSVEVQGATLTIEGENIEHTGMYPTNDCDGPGALIGEVATATAVNGTASDMETIIRIRASLSVNQGTLTSDKKSKLKWAIVDTSTSSTCDNTPYRGTLADASTNTDIDTGIRFTATAKETTSKSYRLYVWLDSTYTHTNVGDEVSDPMQDLSISVKYSPASELSQEFNPSPPELDPGMIPVTIANDGTVKTISASNSSWYNYSDKQWANVVLVNETSRSNYLGTTGKTITQSDILAYYVWIPRYKYRIPVMNCSELDNPTMENNPDCYLPYTMSDGDKELLINYLFDLNYDYYLEDFDYIYTIEEATEDVEIMLSTRTLDKEIENYIYRFDEVIEWYNDENDTPITYTGTFNGNNITLGPRTIDIVFEPKDATKSMGDAVNTYYTHPAFTWDGNNVGGIWVGKFETTGNRTTPTVLPNVSSLTDQNISNQFTTSLKFAGGALSNGRVTFEGNNTYGLISTTDSHMMKNSDWGAVAYLSHSQYGINDEIRSNNNKYYITGCGSLEENVEDTEECQVAYGSGVASYPQSTTGNITGIFDMSGGCWESVMGVYSDSNGNPMSGDNSQYNSGFNGLLSDGTTYSSGISFPQSKYYDLYLRSQFTGPSQYRVRFCTLETCGGHAINETTKWYGDEAVFVTSGNSWFIRGYGDNDAGIFNLLTSSGFAFANHSWHSVLVVDGA